MTDAPVIDIGISEADREAIAEGLSRLLADSYTLYLKTHNYHWNVTGPMFGTLHGLFELEYQDLALAVDEIAERIRSVGELSPGSYQEFAELASVKEVRGVPKDGKPIEAKDMIKDLVKDQEKVVKAARKLVEAAAKSGDQASEDLGVRRIDVHEKNAWMLRSHLE